MPVQQRAFDDDEYHDLCAFFHRRCNAMSRGEAAEETVVLNFSRLVRGRPSSSRLTTAAWRHRALARLDARIARFKMLPCLAGITR